MQDSNPNGVVTLPARFLELSLALGPYGCLVYLGLYRACGGSGDWFELSVRELAPACNVSIPTVRSALNVLVSVSLIERTSAPSPRDPDHYRLPGLPSRPKPKEKPAPLFALEPTPPPAPAVDEFEEWWKHYPKKHSKGQAKITWEKLTKAKALPGLEVLVAAADAYAAYVAAEEIDHSKTQNGSTWLNAEGWLNEYKTKRRASQRTGAYDDL